MWTDIFRTNRPAMLKAVDQMIAELSRFRRHLERDDAEAVLKWLSAGKNARDRWIQRRYRKKVPPP